MMDYGADQEIKWKNVASKAWSNRELGFKQNIKKDFSFLKKVVKHMNLRKPSC